MSHHRHDNDHNHDSSLELAIEQLVHAQRTLSRELHELVYLGREQLALSRRLQCIGEQILHVLTPHQLTYSIAVRGNNMQDNVLVLKVGQTSFASIMPFLADGITPSGGTVSDVSFDFNDPSASIVLNDDGRTATVTGLQASTNGPVAGTAHCTVTDTDEAVSHWDQQFTVEVQEGAPPDQPTQSVAVQFSDPVGSGPGTGSGPLAQQPGMSGTQGATNPAPVVNGAGSPNVSQSNKRPLNE